MNSIEDKMRYFNLNRLIYSAGNLQLKQNVPCHLNGCDHLLDSITYLPKCSITSLNIINKIIWNIWDNECCYIIWVTWMISHCTIGKNWRVHYFIMLWLLWYSDGTHVTKWICHVVIYAYMGGLESTWFK